MPWRLGFAAALVSIFVWRPGLEEAVWIATEVTVNVWALLHHLSEPAYKAFSTRRSGLLTLIASASSPNYAATALETRRDPSQWCEVGGSDYMACSSAM